jgi:putative ABC transport system permease protein
MLAIVDSVLLRPTALPHSEQLVTPYATGADLAGWHGSGASLNYAFPYKQIDQMRDGTRDTFAGWGGYNTMVQPVETKEGARVSEATLVTTGFFGMLGIRAERGRLFGTGDAGALVVVVNDSFWRERLGSDSYALGSAIKVGGQMRTLIGVLPASAHFPQGTSGPAVYLPISVDAKGADQFKLDSALAIGRVKPGVSIEQALQNLRAVAAHFDLPDGGKRQTLHLQRYQDYITGDVQVPLYALLAAVAVLLLIACANAANLQIARAVGRVPEVMIRSALGAGFGRLLQQLVAENMLISVGSAVLGSGLAFAATAWLRSTYGPQFTRFDELEVRPEVLAMLGVLAIALGVATSLALALKIRRQTRASFAMRTVTRASRVPGVLVAVQVCLTCVLLVVCGLLLRTFQKLENVGLGFDARNVTTLVLMPGNQQQDPQVSRQTETRLLKTFDHLPGVAAATMQTALPFSNYTVTLTGTTDVTGRVFQRDDKADYSLASTNFVKASGIRLLRGRSFIPADESSQDMSVLINRAFADRYFAHRNPIGQKIHFHREPKETDADLPFSQFMTVAGVVENELEGGDLGAPYRPMVYLNYLQLPKGSMLSPVFNMSAQYAIRSTLAANVLAAELRAAIRKTAPDMVEMHLSPMREDVAQSLNQRRLALRLVAGFGLMALVLSSIGVYGVLAHSVALRRREIGIRLVLGCSRTRATQLVTRQAATMVLLGLMPGLFGAWAAARTVRSLLFGVDVFDPPTLIGAGIVILLAGSFASLFPAVHAALLDPADTLRME